MKKRIHIFDEWDVVERLVRPYRLVNGREGFTSSGRESEKGSRQEAFIAKYDDRDQALAHLRRLVQKQHEPFVIEGAISADDEQEGKR
jgi:hypothetical protein